MPLVYDDQPGSWGEYSKNWVKIVCKNSDEAFRMFAINNKFNIIPYGSYVLVDNEYRIENNQLKVKFEDFLKKINFFSC